MVFGQMDVVPTAEDANLDTTKLIGKTLHAF